MPDRRVASLLLIACVVLSGCAGLGTRAPNRLPPWRALVVPRLTGDDNQVVVQTATDLLLRGLRDAGEVLSTREFVDEAGAAGLLVWAPLLLDRLQRGGWPSREERVTLTERFGIHTIILADVTTYEQVWGKYAKFTRAAVEAQAFHIPSERIIWRVRGNAEVEEKRGRAFQLALEEAVQAVVNGIQPRPFSVTELWRSWRR